MATKVKDESLDMQTTLLMQDKGFQKFLADKIKAEGGGAGSNGGDGSGGGAGGAGGGDGKGGKKSIFFSDKSAVEIKTPEEFISWAKEKLAIDVPTQGFTPIATSIEKWRKDSQELPVVKKKIEGINDTMKVLPLPLKKAIEAFSVRGDSNDAIKAFQQAISKISYDKNASDFSKEDLVGYYMRDKFVKLKTEKDTSAITPEAYQEKLELLHEAAEKIFDVEKREFETAKDNVLLQATTLKEKKSESIDKSIEYLKKKFSGFDDARIEKIKSRLSGDDFWSLYYNDDGTIKEDGAVKLALSEFGEEEIQNQVVNTTKDATTDATLKIVDAANKEASLNKTAAAEGKLSPELQEQVDNMTGGPKRYTY